MLTEAEEVFVKRNVRRPIGTIMLKGENIALIRCADASAQMQTDD